MKEKKPVGRLVMYRAYDGYETFICTPADEKYLLKHWFAKHTKRSRKAYYRCVSRGVIEVCVRMTATPEDTIEEEDGGG